MHSVKCRIICIGNRFLQEDSAGIAVYEKLKTYKNLTPEIKLIEGGTAGLNLLPHLEQGGVVIFVDNIKGYTKSRKVVLLEEDQIRESLAPGPYDHGAGLQYLLTVLPKVYEGVLPDKIVLVGIEGVWTEQLVEQAAQVTVDTAFQQMKGLHNG